MGVFNQKFDLSGEVRPLSPTGRSFAYEGDITTGSRVSRKNVGRARAGLKKSRAKTVKGKFSAIKRGGGLTSKGAKGNETLRKQVRGRKLTTGEVRNRTAARAAKKAAGTKAGRQRTTQIITEARRAAAKRVIR